MLMMIIISQESLAVAVRIRSFNGLELDTLIGASSWQLASTLEVCECYLRKAAETIMGVP